MDEALVRLTFNSNWKDQLRKVCRLNKVPAAIANHYNPDRFKTSLTRFIKSHQSSTTKDKWLQNQLKACHWFIIVISHLSQKKILDFEQEEWSLLISVFSYRRQWIVRYQTLKFINQTGSSTPWRPEEEIALREVMNSKEESPNKWNDKAFELFQKSQGKYLRTGKQCRQKWLNSLNPLNNRTEWSPIEDVKLAELVLKRGRKWSALAKDLNSNRTEHMAKKRYKAIILQLRKDYPEILDEDTLLLKFIESHLSLDVFKGQPSNLVNETHHSESQFQKKDNESQVKQSEQSKRKILISQIQQFLPIQQSNSSKSCHFSPINSPCLYNLHQSSMNENSGYLLNSFASFQNAFIDHYSQSLKESSEPQRRKL